MIVVVDYGLGNVGSIVNMIKKVGYKAKVTSSAADILAAERIILPGVGAYDAGMSKLAAKGLIEPLGKAVLEKKIPILGICLGMQLMTNGSEEGKFKGLGWVDASVKKIAFDELDKKVPHMGWNTIKPEKPSLVLEGLNQNSRFYFVHSYYVDCHRSEDILLSTKYYRTFVSGFEAGNIIGFQFHPEKSHKFGMQIFTNFLKGLKNA